MEISHFTLITDNPLCIYGNVPDVNHGRKSKPSHVKAKHLIGKPHLNGNV